MVTTYFGRGSTCKTAFWIYHLPDSIVNQIELNIHPDYVPEIPYTLPLGVLREPLESSRPCLGISCPWQRPQAVVCWI